MVDSVLLTLDDVISKRYFFNIPIYQRLYVWGKEQIQAMLSDIWDACKEGKDIFYLGGALVIERPVKSNAKYKLYDLIDGQQRFTTLWLISIAWEGCLADYRFEESIESGDHYRVEFSIRPQVKSFFDAKFSGITVDFEETRCLQDALKEIMDFPNNRKQEGDVVNLVKFTQYIRKNVKLVFTEVPKNTDLNKLFEVINNRGVQLQHHEILKARLLGKIQTNEREYYGQLWDACSNMNDYVEKNLRNITGLKILELFNYESSKTDEEKLANAKNVLSALKRLKVKSDQFDLTSLESILKSEDSFEQIKIAEDVKDYQSERVRSIISFSMFLQHVLRIFLVKNKLADINKILDKDLISIFENHWLDIDTSPDDVKEFIELLWEIRYRFDKHIIKWVEIEGGEIHAIRRLRINKSGRVSNSYSSLIRDTTDSESEFALLQSMLYHSQQMTTHYWLTPLLYFLWREDSKNAFIFLQYMDNHLLCAFNEEPLIERTEWFLDDFWYAIEEDLDVSDVLNENDGTKFAHYWFYKLEFILWYQMRRKIVKWQNFRMTAKNSVEHISPQNPKEFDSNKVSPNRLDSFGNLSLVSRSINSEFSNKPYAEKRARFIEENREVADSLKMDIIYQNKTWNDELADNHKKEMIKAFSTYFDLVNKKVKNIMA
jgi:hypothetical protein